MDVDVVRAGKARWLILIYQLPREPSRHRVAVWRRLKSLGALYLQDGAAALPEDAEALRAARRVLKGDTGAVDRGGARG